MFITTDLTRLQSRHRQETQATLSYVAIRIDQGEEVCRGPNPPELLALLVALGCGRKLGRPPTYNEEIVYDCKSVVDYVNKHRQTRLRNENGKLPFLMAIKKGSLSANDLQSDTILSLYVGGRPNVLLHPKATRSASSSCGFGPRPSFSP